ncbi:hypothetical protein NS331_22850 [Pseudacidovorax intermedius]|uniref:Chemotaxis protein CheW n=2 Tax=Pseudacidovorax intermedius TaxID=433924 RepID=A0A147GMF9_9BURK|nr:hypothetical protein NS331_22850 [Pseudacidovorax intermedius]
MPRSAFPAEILSFRLGEEHYGIDILKVQEIRGWEPATRIPSAPPEVRGVINLRGHVVPIMDLRLRFAMPDADCGPLTVVIIAKAAGRMVGMVVDAVSEVMALEPAQVQPGPAIAAVDAACITGLATVNDQMVMLLDLDALLQHIHA